ncbi:hypothetical protein Vretimale_17642 [Volvox reticuliferus]|uniref:Phosphoribosyl-AMP cyclohydrolase domain-containing protein n=1 Tax=Volvox reticuliferus TaxID=1737510 RepID=A0A8J4D0G1_9CHLO|nr:hypothetical protein Vretifemale_18108 [Volvox reticuliferus]GIM14701.1 hypothetical protein Vretimale_17642 [Volvox reticuliferus]
MMQTRRIQHAAHCNLFGTLHPRPCMFFRRFRTNQLVRRVRFNSSSSLDATGEKTVQPEQDVPGLTTFLESLKWDKNNLVAVIVQHIDTGEVLMQAFADRAALNETIQTGLATFYSRSRGGRWCKGETSGHFIKVQKIFTDCDRDSIIYLSDPIGPACHTGARTCWFKEVQIVVDGTEGKMDTFAVIHEGAHTHGDHVPRTTLQALEQTIAQRRREALQRPSDGSKPSWTVRLLGNPELLCKKIREEAGELCQTLEANEGRERAASEMADLLYHSMVLLNLQGVEMEEVLRVLRNRFTQSGIEEKASRPPKPQ